MKVFLSRPLPRPVIEAAQAVADVTLRPDTGPLSGAEMRAALAEYDVVMPTLGDQFQADVFADVPAPKCKLLANFGVGYNHIDVAAARAAGVEVTNTPGAVTDATADIAMTLMLMSARRAAEGERLVRSGAWDGWHPTQMLGLHVTGKTVGIVGMGRIGQAIARRCHYGFSMEVCYFSRSDKVLDHPAKRFDVLADMAAQVDVLVVAVPAGPATHHIISEAVIAAMRPHAHLINIARGDVVDETRLITALQERRIGGAGLDVYEFEPDVPLALREMDNVTLFPHLGTAAEEVRIGMGLMVVDNLRAFAAGAPLPNPV